MAVKKQTRATQSKIQLVEMVAKNLRHSLDYADKELAGGKSAAVMIVVVPAHGPPIATCIEGDSNWALAEAARSAARSLENG